MIALFEGKMTDDDTNCQEIMHKLFIALLFLPLI